MCECHSCFVSINFFVIYFLLCGLQTKLFASQLNGIMYLCECPSFGAAVLQQPLLKWSCCSAWEKRPIAQIYAFLWVGETIATTSRGASLSCMPPSLQITGSVYAVWANPLIPPNDWEEFFLQSNAGEGNCVALCHPFYNMCSFEL